MSYIPMCSLLSLIWQQGNINNALDEAYSVVIRVHVNSRYSLIMRISSPSFGKEKLMMWEYKTLHILYTLAFNSSFTCHYNTDNGDNTFLTVHVQV